MGELLYTMITIMDERDINQSELCDLTGIPSSTMSRYINGADIPASKLKAIASALGVTVDDLLGLSTQLTQDERELVQAYRQLDSRDKAAVLQLAHTLSADSTCRAEEGVA